VSHAGAARGGGQSVERSSLEGKRLIGWRKRTRFGRASRKVYRNRFHQTKKTLAPRVGIDGIGSIETDME
jgi:hypothetical protein